MNRKIDAPLSFEENPVATDFSLANKYGTGEFEKYRLKSKSATVDVALMSLKEDEVKEQIEKRREEFQDLEIRVPSPYTAEIEQKDQEEEYSVEFYNDQEKIYGLAYADPDYKLMVQDQERIPRYRYYLTWRYFPREEKLAEIEIYILRDKFEKDEARELAESVVIQ